MIIGDLLVWLQNHHKGLSGTEICRKSGVSQGWISKMSLGGATRFPDPDVCQRLVDAYPEDWRRFLRTHPAAVREIRAKFSWALAAHREGSPATLSPELAEALGYLETISGAPAHARVARAQLKTLADLAAADLAGTEPTGPASRRRRRKRP